MTNNTQEIAMDLKPSHHSNLTMLDKFLSGAKVGL